MTDRICIEKYKPEDFEMYYALSRNDTIMEMITGKGLTYDEALKRFDEMLDTNNIHEGFGFFKVFNIQTKEYLGLAKLEITKDNYENAEIGYMWFTNYWHMGYGNEIARYMIHYVRKFPFVETLFGVINENNTASRKILINAGFTHKVFLDAKSAKTEILELIL